LLEEISDHSQVREEISVTEVVAAHDFSALTLPWALVAGTRSPVRSLLSRFGRVAVPHGGPELARVDGRVAVLTEGGSRRGWADGGHPAKQTYKNGYVSSFVEPRERLGGSRGIAGAASGPARRPAWPRADLRADLRAALREPRADLRVALRAGFCDPHPPPPPSDQLSRGWGFRRTERNSFRAFALTIPSGCNLLLPEGIHTHEEFLQTREGRGPEAGGSVRTRPRGDYQPPNLQFF